MRIVKANSDAQRKLCCTECENTDNLYLLNLKTTSICLCINCLIELEMESRIKVNLELLEKGHFRRVVK